MDKYYVIALDVHSYSSHAVVLTPSGRRREERTLPTGITALRELVQATPRPRRVVFEEGPLAGWLYRNLQQDAEVVVAETRRNAYIAKDGDKSDSIDAGKLAQLAQTKGMIRPVHQVADPQRAMFKDLVLYYHKLVRERTREANRLIWMIRRHGVVIRESGFAQAEDRSALLSQLPRHKLLREMVEMAFASYDLAVRQEHNCEQQLERRGRRVRMIRNFADLPGVRWIRGATFYALIDTPFRFPSKAALWRYMGIGLQHRSSGKGREQVGTSPACNHYLKDMILGAAQCALNTREPNPFSEQYWRCIQQGKSSRVARRTTARSLATVMWGMWKSETIYRPDWVGRAPQQPRSNRLREA
jgi:transposase